MARLCIFKVCAFGENWRVERLGEFDECGMANYRLMKERRIVAKDYATSGLHLIRLSIKLATNNILQVGEGEKI